MCEERFDGVTQLDEASILDSAVANVSKEIIDDYPASDPRWAEAIPAGTFMQIIVDEHLRIRLTFPSFLVLQ